MRLRRPRRRCAPQSGGEALAHGQVLDPCERVGIERRDEHLLGLPALEAAGHEEEEQLRVDPADRGRVRAAHVVGEDLETRDRVCVRVAGEQQVAVLLERVGALRARGDLDDPAPDRARVVAQRALVGEIARGVRGGVLLRGVEIEVLALAERVQARCPHRGARAAQARLLTRLAELAAQPQREPAQRGVARDLGPGGAEVVRVVMQFLRLHEVDLGAVAEHQLDRAVEVAGLAGGELLEQRQARAGVDDDEGAPERARAGLRVLDHQAQGQADGDSRRDVHERAAAPGRRVLGDEAVAQVEHAAEVPVDQLAVRLHGGVQRREYDARCARGLVQPDMDRLLAALHELTGGLEIAEHCGVRRARRRRR